MMSSALLLYDDFRRTCRGKTVPEASQDKSSVPINESLNFTEA